MTVCNRRYLLSTLILATPVCGTIEAPAARPVVGLAGIKYKRAYVSALDRIRAQGEMISGLTLDDADELRRYAALIIVTKGDPGQEGEGLREQAEEVVAGYVEQGGRVLCAPCEFDDSRAKNAEAKVGEGYVRVTWRVGETSYEVQLKLAGQDGRSPSLKVTADGVTVCQRDDLSVPPDVLG